MKRRCYKNIIMFGIFILFVGSTILPNITIKGIIFSEGIYCLSENSKDFFNNRFESECFFVKIGYEPPDPPIIEGPRCGDPGEELTYTFVSDDFEGDNVFYFVDWGDDTFDDWFGPFPSGEKATASHSWDEKGGYEIIARAKDTQDSESGWSEPYSILIGENSPPEKPTIDGPKKGSMGTGYGYIFVTTDPDENKIIYEIDWGDGKSDETELHLSGEEVVINHAWDFPGLFTIKARAKDEFCGSYSEWSEYDVNIPRNRAIKFNFIGWFFEQFQSIFQIIENFIKLNCLFII